MTRAGLDRRTLLGGAAAVAAARPAVAQGATPRLRRGINTWPWFGLTREFPAPRTDYAWPPFEQDRPVPRAADLATLRAAGFDFVRIPIDAGAFLAFSGAHEAALLDKLDAAIDAAHAAGLAAIVNLAINTATHYQTNARLLGGLDTPGFADYRAVAAKLAARLARADPARTLFEPVNEPPGACADTLWPTMQIRLLDAARAAAPRLPLVATGACGGMSGGLVALDPGPLRRFAPLLFTFHFYEPYVFSHQGAPWMAAAEPMYGVLTGVPWPAAAGTRAATLAAVRHRAAATGGAPGALQAAERAVNDYFDGAPGPAYLTPFFDEVGRWARKNDIDPADVLLGELGALRTDARYVAAASADRARYIRDVREAAERHGFAWAFWNLFDGMGLMDEATRSLDPAIADALGLRPPP